jgi:hypothetical protein
LALVAAAAVWGMAPSAAQAQIRQSSPNDLFYNYYVPPGSSFGVGAAMYPSPRPTPPLVGHTYITYQPLMPQEFLYKHRRVYSRNHGDGSVTRTTVSWGHCATLCPFQPSKRWAMPALCAPPPMGGPCEGVH